MTTPKRVQRTRTKGGGIPKGAVYVGRPTLFGNPFTVESFIEAGYSGKNAPQFITIAYRRWLLKTDHHFFEQQKRSRVLARIPYLKGKDLACWCPLPEPGQPDHCHAAVLLELANPELKDDESL